MREVLFLICIGIIPQETTLKDHVDMVEINHFYNEQGALVFDQVIYWDWNGAEGRFEVVDWRLIKNARAELTEAERFKLQQIQPVMMIKDGSQVRMPVVPEWIGSPKVPIKRAGICKSIFWDGDQLREVTCGFVRETWTQHDPELQDRNKLPRQHRRLLSKSPLFVRTTLYKYGVRYGVPTPAPPETRP
jgi:hypothetical protein